MLKLVFFFFGISLSTFLMAQPDSLIEPPLFKDQTIIDRFPPPPPPPPSIYIIDEENFRIKLFCSEKPKVDSLDYIKQKTYQCQKGGVTLTIIQTTYDNGMYHSDSLSRIEYDLNYTQRKFTKNNDVRLTSALPRSTKGYPGYEFRYDFSFVDKFTFRRVYIVKNTLYELIYEGPMASKFNKDMDAFFDSFQLKNIESNTTPYLNLPTEEDLKIFPYTANFFGETQIKVDNLEANFGKFTSIMQSHEFEGTALAISHSKLPTNLTTSDSIQLINGYVELPTKNPNFTLLSIEEDERGKRICMATKMGGVDIIFEVVSFINRNTHYSMSAIYIKDQPKDKRIDEFFESFKLIE